ncbi:MAG: beta-ketoacyl-[acyl-carrier-protein] synthase family protein, partial [Myxococcota bacterium]|nr:beta-ketoacyl-[acyl-carrier-protein] synthase family protein [Myxococcota bacterium]
APSDVDYINAHATGTPLGDLSEGKAILSLFGCEGPLVSSTKSMTGHECWMAGASEVVYSCIMMQGGFIAPNINLKEIEPALAGLKVISSTQEKRVKRFLSNSFGFGGTNASLLCAAFEG